MEDVATWSFKGNQGAEPARSNGPGTDVQARVRVIARRYYPIGIGAAFLAMVAGFFPSTSQLLLGGSFFASPAGSGTPAASPSPAPAASQQPQVNASAPGGFGFSIAPSNVASFAPESPVSAYDDEPLPPASETPPSGTGGSVPPSSQCPVPVPTTSTPADSLLGEVASLCEDLLGSSGSKATGSSRDWVYLGRLSHSQGQLANGTTARAGTTVVLVGIDQQSNVLSSSQATTSLSRTLSSLGRSGVLTGVLAVPDAATTDTRLGASPTDIAAFATEISSSFASLPMIGVAAPVPSSSAPASSGAPEAEEVVDALGSLESRHVQGQSVGVWLGTTPNGCIGSSQLVANLVSAASSSAAASEAWRSEQFLGAASPETSGCGGLPAFYSQVAALSLPEDLATLFTAPAQSGR